MEGLSFVEKIAFYKSTNTNIPLNVCSVHVEQDPLMNRSKVMAATETEALAGAEGLVATTSQRQTGTDNNQLKAAMAMVWR